MEFAARAGRVVRGPVPAAALHDVHRADFSNQTRAFSALGKVCGIKRGNTK